MVREIAFLCAESILGGRKPLLLDVTSSNRGVLFPRMDSTHRNSISLTTGIINLTLVGGSGYTTGTYTISFSGGGGTGAAGTVTVVTGQYGSYIISNYGSGYTSAPTATISAGAGSGGSITVNIPSIEGLTIFCTNCIANDGSTGVIQTHSSSAWRNLY